MPAWPWPLRPPVRRHLTWCVCVCTTGFWFSPEQEFIMAGVKQSQQGVDGSVELKLTRGNVYVHPPVVSVCACA